MEPSSAKETLMSKWNLRLPDNENGFDEAGSSDFESFTFSFDKKKMKIRIWKSEG